MATVNERGDSLTGALHFLIVQKPGHFFKAFSVILQFIAMI